MVRFIHLSDLHFFYMDWRCRHLFSKAFIANCNFLLRRRREFNYQQLDSLLVLAKEKQPSFALISGDMSCSASPKEFAKGKAFIQCLQQNGIETVVLPGNHDKYTKQAAQKLLFYRAFPSSLAQDGVYAKRISPHWWLISLDTTHLLSLFQHHGTFYEKIEQNLDKVLSRIPSTEHVIIANHFPLLSPKKKDLRRHEALQALCKRYPHIRLYLHGHTHRPHIVDGRGLGLPVSVDAGSCVHRKLGGWNLVECDHNCCTIYPFTWSDMGWKENPSRTFSWHVGS